MAACIEKHDVAGDVAAPRLSLVTTLSISAPIVCHHCVDAPCVNACPEGALFFDGTRVGVRQSLCIGCRGCVMACPYGAVDVYASTQEYRIGDVVIGDKPKANLLKCDLCYDREEGPVCIQACPTNALRLVDESNLEQDIRQKRVAAAESSVSSVPLNAVLTS
ncbi:MAG: 4Fe-4S dicluster domain-containing protein [Coriobacteriales bacterium]|nr:4Fe-4S dicluster domain-containing protein [Coriobacteriales bacterium]